MNNLANKEQRADKTSGLNCSGMTPTDRANNKRFVVMTLVWGAAYIGAALVLKYVDGLSILIASAVALAPVLVGLLALLAFLRFMRHADELIQRIQYEALATGFGIGILFNLTYPMLETAGWPTLMDGVPATVMFLGWAFGEIIARRRYR